jgi:hypothetical protein
MFPWKRGPITAASAVFLSFACSPGGGNTDDLNLNQGYSGNTGAGGVQGNAGVPPGPGTGGATLIVPIGTGGIATGPDGSCLATGAKAERVVVTKEVPVTVTVTEKSPVALYLMQDQSGSMLLPIFPMTRWDMARTAVQAFTQDPQSAGLDIAIQFFALPTPACDGTGGYDVPEVPLGPLPQNGAAINNAYLAHFPSTGTPIEPGLRGAVNFCLKFESTNSQEDCVAVLITDGAPSDCLTDANGLAAIAADAFSKGVMTFAIGMDGADFTLMDLIAKSGGSDCTPGSPGQEACNVSGGASTAQGFIDALNTIRKTVSHDVTTTKTVTEVHTSELACDFQIPPPPGNEKFDPEKVNVHFKHAGVDDAVLQVPSEADCAKAGDQGWFYDNPTAPTAIKVCSGTCAAIKASTADGGVTIGDPPEVQVLLGCQTDKAPIH